MDDHDVRIDADLTRVTVPVSQDRFDIDDAVTVTLARSGSELGRLVFGDRMQAWLER
ncbi:hypothetical protein GZH49_40290 [Nocardia terpenica]